MKIWSLLLDKGKCSLSNKSKFNQSLNHNHGHTKQSEGDFAPGILGVHLISHVKIY